MSVFELRSRLGLARSLLMYYGVPGKRHRLKTFYREFMAPGDLCFDIGAHVGDRLAAWRALGARVVALEPQPQCMALLRRWYGADPGVILLAEAAGGRSGTAVLQMSELTPTVSTLSADWRREVGASRRFSRVRWQREQTVRVTTLAELVARFGRPVFCKVDVEGYEGEVLAGLDTPLAALSFEYIPAAPRPALSALARVTELGDYEFNCSEGESLKWRWRQWLPADRVRRWLLSLPAEAASGDIYARRR